MFSVFQRGWDIDELTAQAEDSEGCLKVGVALLLVWLDLCIYQVHLAPGQEICMKESCPPCWKSREGSLLEVPRFKGHFSLDLNYKVKGDLHLKWSPPENLKHTQKNKKWKKKWFFIYLQFLKSMHGGLWVVGHSPGSLFLPSPTKGRTCTPTLGWRTGESHDWVMQSAEMVEVAEDRSWRSSSCGAWCCCCCSCCCPRSNILYTTYKWLWQLTNNYHHNNNNDSNSKRIQQWYAIEIRWSIII